MKNAWQSRQKTDKLKKSRTAGVAAGQDEAAVKEPAENHDLQDESVVEAVEIDQSAFASVELDDRYSEEHEDKVTKPPPPKKTKRSKGTPAGGKGGGDSRKGEGQDFGDEADE
jgi:hypothetical protein